MEPLPSSDGNLDDLFTAFAHPARRQKLMALYRERQHGDGRVTVSTEVGSTSPTEMYHRHLPKLAAYGYLQHDREDTVVQPGPNFDQVDQFLDVSVDQSLVRKQ